MGSCCQKKLFHFKFSILYSLFPILLSFPASPNYRLDEWSIGAGGNDRGQSANYQVETITDPTIGQDMESTSYQIKPGQLGIQLANVPPAPTFTNPDDRYDRLHLVINTGNNPSDTNYAVAISSDNFLTTYYVKADNTIGTTLTASDWRSYASWGGATGINVLGLQSNTTYLVRVKAEQGDFTESGWGPTASATTSPPKLSFDLDVAATDTETAAPYTVALGTLNSNTVTTATDRIWIDLTTNANSGAVVYVTGDNGGLHSTTADHTISAVSADLSGQSEGFGLQNSSITQTSGGPFAATSPFNGSGTTVGSTGTLLIPINESTAPLTNGRSSQDVMTIISAMTPAASDYTETITLVAAGTF